MRLIKLALLFLVPFLWWPPDMPPPKQNDGPPKKWERRQVTQYGRMKLIEYPPWQRVPRQEKKHKDRG